MSGERAQQDILMYVSASDNVSSFAFLNIASLHITSYTEEVQRQCKFMAFQLPHSPLSITNLNLMTFAYSKIEQ